MMKVPSCGMLIAATESAPNRLVTMILLVSTSAGSNVQVNSALEYPSAGTLFKLTVANVVSPIVRLVGFTVVDT